MADGASAAIAADAALYSLSGAVDPGRPDVVGFEPDREVLGAVALVRRRKRLPTILRDL